MFELKSLNQQTGVVLVRFSAPITRPVRRAGNFRDYGDSPARSRRALETPSESVGCCRVRGAGRIHGGARHLHRQRSPASHRRIAGCQHRRSNLGAHQLPVSNAIVLPMGGWISSVMGRRNFFLLCIIIFTVSSFLCGAAPSLPMLLVFRVMQGIGGGGMQPMAQAIMADSFEPQKRGQAFALYGLVAVLAPSIGPTLGGWITDNFTWRWIFFINIPGGHSGFLSGHRLVEDPPWIKADRSRLGKWTTWASASSPSPWAACRSCSTRAKKTTGSPPASFASLLCCLSAA
jgi:hypothetical protein